MNKICKTVFNRPTILSPYLNLGTLAGIITPNLIGPILDHVSLYPTTRDCLTNLDITPPDYRVPFAIADAALLGKDS